jgi:16S rRNA (guanine(1405)-N(7))-methyltransferase
MIDQPLSESEKEQLRAILNSRKYRCLAIPEETVESLYRQALLNGITPREALKSVRQKLHNIVAPYLGDANFNEAAADLDAAFKDGVDEIKAVCTRILESHASTRERLSIMETFYSQIFSLTGKPQSILDLACGLNPFAFPWMGLPNTTKYHAFDLNLPRIELINHFFKLEGLERLAAHQDILIHTPNIDADVAFLFKEAHRLEQRQRGCNRVLWQALQVRWLLVSLPTSSLSGKHDLLGKHRRLVEQTCSGQSWTIHEIMFTNEIVFCIDKGSA